MTAHSISILSELKMTSFGPYAGAKKCSPSVALVYVIYYIFTALHEMQTRSSDENSVRQSVRLSVRRVICDKMEERSVQIFIPYERTFSLVF